jgi:hypothetical protein
VILINKKLFSFFIFCLFFCVSLISTNVYGNNVSKNEIYQYDCECNCNDFYYDIFISSDYDYFCKHDDLSRRQMETWICDNLDAGSRHNPCWCHLGIHTYFIGKDGIYSFTNIEGITRHTEMCGWGNSGTEDMSICDNFGTWPIDGEAWDPDSWQWYLESSIDGIHWQLVSKYPFDKIKQSTPFGPTSISSRNFRFIRLRMPTDRRGIGLAGYMDNSKFNINEQKTTNINSEGYTISRIEGSARAHKYRSMQIEKMLVQISYDGTTDWNTIHEFSINNNQQKSFDVTLDSPTLTRFVRIIPKSGLWNGMPATPGFVDHSSITITHLQGSLTLGCEEDTMECSLSPIHHCYSGGQGYSSGNYNTCENYMMSGSFHHTYPLLSNQMTNNGPAKPNAPTGETECELGVEYSYLASTVDPEGDDIYYMFDFEAGGDHYLIPWQGPYSSGQTVTASHSWEDGRSHKIKVKAKDEYGYESDWSNALAITIDGSINQKPEKPNTPTGTAQGNAGTEYTYETSTTDPNGDEVYYKWDWGDQKSEWDGPYESGETVTMTHKWFSTGDFDVMVKAKDSHDAESDWSEPFSVEMPRTRQYSLFYVLFGEFPIIQQLLKIILHLQ